MAEEKEGKIRDIIDKKTGKSSSSNMETTIDDLSIRSVRPASNVAGVSTSSARKMVREAQISGVIFPWSKGYKTWWGLTVICAILTIFTETFQIAFGPGGLPQNDAGASATEYILLSIFVVDIGVSFFLAYFNEDDEIIYDRKLIAKNYLRRMFWIDVLGVFPFYALALACAGQVGQDNSTTQFLALLRLVKLVRLYRVKQLFDVLQYNARVSLTLLTVTRNFAAALVWSHFSACTLYFIAREFNFDPDNTWIGGQVADMDTFERYVTSLYWAIVTFTTVGYGDYSPVNEIEQVWGITFMLLNMIISSWIIGSMTLLIVKQDEATGLYRDALQVLKQYAAIHNLDRATHKSLKTQLKLEFKNREIADEQVLAQFPSAVRRKVLRKLYLPSLLQTGLLQNTRQQFIDAFLSGCSVEVFCPGEELLHRGSACSDLYLLVEGVVSLIKPAGRFFGDDAQGANGSEGVLVKAGEFINEIGFFTESPQIDTVRTKTVCKTLTMSRSAYKVIAENHPGSASNILQNLLAKVDALGEEGGLNALVELPKKIELLRAGYAYEDPSSRGRPAAKAQITSSSAIRDLITIYMSKHEDDKITKFLFAAARGDSGFIARMCDHGFDPNSCDYDQRTALMVAAMKGNTDAVKLILDFQANPNLVDMSGASALYEAARKGHEDTMDEMILRGAKLCMDEGQAASTLCQAVFDGDILTLRRLLKAGIKVDAADYDKRTAAHIAASEGNAAALKVLVEFGADLTAEDRWHSTAIDEGKRSKSRHVLAFLDTVRAAT
jgi:CRP-like cAMP-binding protein